MKTVLQLAFKSVETFKLVNPGDFTVLSSRLLMHDDDPATIPCIAFSI